MRDVSIHLFPNLKAVELLKTLLLFGHRADIIKSILVKFCLAWDVLLNQPEIYWCLWLFGGDLVTLQRIISSYVLCLLCNCIFETCTHIVINRRSAATQVSYVVALGEFYNNETVASISAVCTVLHGRAL